MSGTKNENPFAGFVSSETLDGEPVKAAGSVPAPGAVGGGEGGDSGGVVDEGEEADADDDDSDGAPAGAEAAEKVDEEKSEETAEEKAAREAAAPKPKVKPTVQERINQERRKRGDVERERDGLAAELAALKKAPATGDLTPPAETVKDGVKGRPSPADYQYGELDSKYIADVVKFETKQVLDADKAERAAARDAETEAARKRENQTKFDALRAAGDAEFDDFDEVIRESPVILKELTQEVHDLLLDTEPKVSAKIAYHLARNPKEARALFAKSPLAQAAAFGRLEAQFSAPAANLTPEIQAPKIPAPVHQPRGSGGKFSVSPDTEDFAAFEAMAKLDKG